MLFLFGAAFIAAAYMILRREENAVKADRMFYFGLVLIAFGVIVILAQLYFRRRGGM